MTLIKVKVHVEANREKVVKTGDNRYEVWIKETAKRGLANRRLVKIVAEIANVSAESVKMIKGGRSSSKTFIINGINI